MDSITLYQWPPVGGFESSSPFCNKVHYALHYKRLAFDVKTVFNPAEVQTLNVRGKLPALTWNDATIVDSTDIIRFIEEHAPTPPLYPHDPKARAQALLIEEWADESLYWHLVYERWNIDDQVKLYLDELFTGAPEEARVAIRTHVVGQLNGHGLGLYPLHEHRAKMSAALDWVESLAGNGFLCGPELSVADIATVAEVEGLDVPFTPYSSAEVRKRAGLMRWMDRVKAAVS